MKLTVSFFLLIFSIQLSLAQNFDYISDTTPSNCMADRLDSLLIDWYKTYSSDSFATPSFFNDELIIDNWKKQGVDKYNRC